MASSTAAAENTENGRYQAIAIEMGGVGNISEVLILDTKDGHLWRYWNAPTMGNTPGSEGVKYIMQISPATKPGEVIRSETYRLSK
jgi:hypothetical protein